MDIQSMLAANNSKLLEVYHENHSATVELQQTLLCDVFPHVMDELELGRDSDAASWARVWIEDTIAMFHFYRRHKFTRSFAMESIRQNLVWRIQNIHPRAEAPPLGLLHCLPSEIRDPFKRPIIILKVSDLAAENGKEDLKNLLMPTIDRLQVHLKELNKSADHKVPLLQYVILLDLDDVSMQSMDINLITWAMREVIPHFPGMIAAVFMLNYSWTHQGLWTLAKRVLPASALSRILFPSSKELEAYFTLSCLPKEYGGSLACLEDLDDPLRPRTDCSAIGPNDPPASPQSPLLTPQPFATVPRTSSHTPLYGYPSWYGRTRIPSHAAPGRRRTHDLLRTLAGMWWNRWKVHANVIMWSALTLVAARVCAKRGLRMSDVLRVWKRFLSYTSNR